MPASLKERMNKGEPVIGTFVFLPSPSLVEILGQCGFDFVVIDLEHSPKNWETVEHMVRAGELGGASVLIRTRDIHEKSILEALELGVEGVVVPFISTAEDSRVAAAAAKYPPDGVRGTCTATRSARFGGLRAGFVEHAKALNERTLVVAQLEDAAAVDHAEAIAAVQPGADVLVVGRADLATSLGCAGQVNDPKVLDATNRILKAVVDHGAPGRHSGIAVYGPDEATKWMAKGTRFFLYATDTMMIRTAASEATTAFKALKAT